MSKKINENENPVWIMNSQCMLRREREACCSHRPLVRRALRLSSFFYNGLYKLNVNTFNITTYYMVFILVKYKLYSHTSFKIS